MQQIGIFMSVTLGSLVLFQLVSGYYRPNRGLLRRRLARENATETGTATRLYKDLFALDSGLENGHDLATEVPATRVQTLQKRFEEIARQAGIPVTFNRFLTLSACCGLGAGALGVIFTNGIGGLLGAVAGTITPFLLLDARRKYRRERMLQQLAGAFELMARVMRAGQSVPEALRAVVETFDDPLSGEFASCLHEIEMGLRPEEAFKGLGQRSPVMELRIFVIAMNIHRQTGGNLSEMLDRLSSLVRTRIRLRQRIRSLTAEGRMQSVALVVLPPLTFGVMYFLNRQYAETLLTQGRLLLATAGFMGVGMLWIRRILSFEG